MIRGGFVAACVLAISGTAHAISGSVTGCMVFDDPRLGCCTGEPGCHFNTCGGNGQDQPFKEARVALVAWWGEPGSGTTDSNGCFNFSWNDASCLGPTCTYTLRLFAQNPNDFTVMNTSGATYSASSSVTIRSGATPLGAFQPVDSTAEKWGLYATSQQFFDRIVDQASVLSATMTDIDVVYPVAANETFAPGDHTVNIGIGVANGRPFGVAHELGHLANRHAFGEAIFDYQGCTNAHEWYAVHPCERVPFEEGFAWSWSVPWGWSNNATNPRVDGTVFIERNTLDDTCEGAANCDVEACVAAFLWDVFDDPTPDDDPIDDADATIAVAQMVEILQQYGDNCSGGANRCSNEGGADGRNTWDFLENFDDRYPSLTPSARTILNQLSMDGATACEEPF